MTPYNTRSPQQWRIIKEHVDFNDKSVIDFGCGHADLICMIMKHTSAICTGIDASPIELQAARETCPNIPVSFLLYDVEQYARQMARDGYSYGVGICFSVLPYLRFPDEFLGNMAGLCDVSLIECQYAGDGSGFPQITNATEMANWLLKYWNSVEVIGRTLVENRKLYRDIWMCK